ncbi:transcription factor grauzone-like [Sabethes cyaneus]|uniref:transcription factor grauzone-like n=1 Tax=Sabethes cyaneus TaxID=53552 RepID=UPI00237DEC6E|nr:transcription factor grauzone-like [Sabethes cyaneus]
MDSNLMCRLCLYNNEGILSIFGDRQREVKLQEKLVQYLNLEVKETDTLSKHICLKCFQTVESFHVFYQEVAQNQVVFAYSNQPGMILINDHNSHTTYILREEDKINSSVLDLEAGTSNVRVQNITTQGNPYQKALSNQSQESPKTLTLVDIPSQITATVLSTVDASGNVILSRNGPNTTEMVTSDLPTYDESQQSKDVKSNTHRVAIFSEQITKINVIDSVSSETDVDEPQTDEIYEVDAVYKDLEDDGADDDGNDVADDDDNDDDDDDDDDGDNDNENEIAEFEQIETKPDFSSQNRNAIEMKNIAFPKKLIHDNKLILKGKQLSALMAKFYGVNCEYCQEEENKKKQYSDIDSYVAHCKDVHGTKGHVWCCHKKIFKPRLMAMHMARHLQPEAFRCPECNKLMTTPKILQYHIQNHRPEEERPLKCSICPRRFTYGSALVSHSQSHLPEEERTQHVCDECGKGFNAAKRLAEHIQFVHCKHEQLQSYVCHICARQFTSKSNLSYHLTTHQPKIYQVQCDICKKWLKNKLCLRKHMVQHSAVRHKCNQCDYSAVNLQCLRNHMRVQHTDLKPFACNVCGQSFKLKNTMLNHYVQHTGERKFSCEFCSRTFASSGNYYAHRKRMHPQELAIQKMRKEAEESEFRKRTLLTKPK